LRAAQGNASVAIEFLMNGVPPQAQGNAEPSTDSTEPEATTGGNESGISLNDFRNHPQFRQLQQVVQQNPASLNSVLDLIGAQSPELLEVIHANHQAFVDMMNEPITSEPPARANPASAPADSGSNPLSALGGMNPAMLVQMMNSLPPEQRAEAASSMGMTPEQLTDFTNMLAQQPPEVLQQMLGSMGGMGGPGGPGGPGASGRAGNVIRLSVEEMAAVNRLQELGFNQQQAAQAYLACDKNESLAANLLFDGGFGGEDEEFGGGGGGDNTFS
jgi:UV excision repair protein RAD23